MWHNMLVRLRCRFEMMSTSRFYFSFRHEKQHTAAEVVVMLFFFFTWNAVYRQALLSLPFYFYEILNYTLYFRKFYLSSPIFLSIISG